LATTGILDIVLDADPASHWFSQRDLVPAASGTVSISPSKLPEAAGDPPDITVKKPREAAETRHLADDGDGFEKGTLASHQ
jgi:hypothetical protein